MGERVERRAFQLRVGDLIFDVDELRTQIMPYWFAVSIFLLDPPPDKCELDLLCQHVTLPKDLTYALAGGFYGWIDRQRAKEGYERMRAGLPPPPYRVSLLPPAWPSDDVGPERYAVFIPEEWHA